MISPARPRCDAALLVGTVTRDVGPDVNPFFYHLNFLVTLVVLAMQVWGLAAIDMIALALVPKMFALIVWITLL